MLDLNRNEQILCFAPSVKEVRLCCELFKTHTKFKAFPLYAQQNPVLQEQYLQIGQVFFSTNIAETSITFPNLKYVVDCGKANIA